MMLPNGLFPDDWDFDNDPVAELKRQIQMGIDAGDRGERGPLDVTEFLAECRRYAEAQKDQEPGF